MQYIYTKTQITENALQIIARYSVYFYFYLSTQLCKKVCQNQRCSIKFIGVQIKELITPNYTEKNLVKFSFSFQSLKSYQSDFELHKKKIPNKQQRAEKNQEVYGSCTGLSLFIFVHLDRREVHINRNFFIYFLIKKQKEKIYQLGTSTELGGPVRTSEPKSPKCGTTFSCPELNLPINIHCKLILSENSVQNMDKYKRENKMMATTCL